MACLVEARGEAVVFVPGLWRQQTPHNLVVGPVGVVERQVVGDDAQLLLLYTVADEGRPRLGCCARGIRSGQGA